VDALLFAFASSLIVLGIAYLVGMWMWRGQTLGQVLFNIKVVRADGKPVDLRTAAMRTLGYAVCALTLGIGFLTAAWDDRHQGLHDKIAETFVVKASAA
jgi:uncharacterized RDD family membrane protein YckC